MQNCINMPPRDGLIPPIHEEAIFGPNERSRYHFVGWEPPETRPGQTFQWCDDSATVEQVSSPFWEMGGRERHLAVIEVNCSWTCRIKWQVPRFRKGASFPERGKCFRNGGCGNGHFPGQDWHQGYPIVSSVEALAFDVLRSTLIFRCHTYSRCYLECGPGFQALCVPKTVVRVKL